MGDVIGVGVAELLIVGIAEAFGGAAMTGDQHEAGSATTPAPTAGETECSHCGALNSPQAPWCSGCGRDL